LELVVRMGEIRNVYKILVGNLEEKYRLRVLGMGESITRH
jgi:hypothetical protein